MTILLAILLTIGLIAASSILNGWVLSILWGWFLVPIFGLPPLSIPQAIGVYLVVGFLTKQMDTTKDEYLDRSKMIVATFLWPAVAWVIGAIVKGFM